MKPVEITEELAEKLGGGSIVTFVGPQGLDSVDDLSVLRTHRDNIPEMVSVWELDNEEEFTIMTEPRTRIVVRIIGTMQPPILLQVLRGVDGTLV